MSLGRSLDTSIGVPTNTVKQSAAGPLDEARQQRRICQIRHQHGRPQKPRRPAEQRHRHPIASDVPVHQERDDAILGETPADLQRRVERLPDLERVDAEPVPDLAPDAVRFPGSFGHRDDRQRQVEHAPHEDAAEFPVAVVTTHQDDSAPSGQQVREHLGAFGRHVNQHRRLVPGRAKRAEKVDDIARVGSVGAKRSLGELGPGLVREQRAEIVRHGCASAVHQPPGEPRRGVADCV